MGTTLKELTLIRKYSNEWEIISLLVNVPPNTTSKITYNPPTNKFFVFIYSSVGPQIIDNNFNAKVYWDDTYAGGFVSTGALSDKVFGEGEAPLKIAKNKLSVVISNNTNVYHTVDALFSGFLVPQNLYEPLLYELDGTIDRKIQERIVEQNDRIIELLTRIAERR